MPSVKPASHKINLGAAKHRFPKAARALRKGRIYSAKAKAGLDAVSTYSQSRPWIRRLVFFTGLTVAAGRTTYQEHIETQLVETARLEHPSVNQMEWGEFEKNLIEILNSDTPQMVWPTITDYLHTHPNLGNNPVTTQERYKALIQTGLRQALTPEAFLTLNLILAESITLNPTLDIATQQELLKVLEDEKDFYHKKTFNTDNPHSLVNQIQSFTYSGGENVFQINTANGQRLILGSEISADAIEPSKALLAQLQKETDAIQQALDRHLQAVSNHELDSETQDGIQDRKTILEDALSPRLRHLLHYFSKYEVSEYEKDFELSFQAITHDAKRKTLPARSRFIKGIHPLDSTGGMLAGYGIGPFLMSMNGWSALVKPIPLAIMGSAVQASFSLETPTDQDRLLNWFLPVNGRIIYEDWGNLETE